MKSTLRIVGCVIRKDVPCLLPLVVLTAVVMGLDIAVSRLESLRLLSLFMPYLVLLASCVFANAVFQLDAPASLSDDWLCRPVPRGALLAAKLLLVLAVLYGTRALTTFIVDLALGYPVMEAALEALLLQRNFALIMLPLILMTAVVTTTVVQGIGLLMGLLILVFVIPTPFVQLPGPLDPGLGEALNDNGMYWMAVVPTELMLFLMLCACLWAVYQRRNIALGRALLVSSAALGVVFFLLPMFLLPWQAVFSVQSRAMSAAADEQANAARESLTLYAEHACFPAATLAALDNDTAYTAAQQVLGVNSWNPRQLLGLSEGGLSFITRVAPQGLPRDWRVKGLYVEATYRDAATGASIALRPASYVTGGSSGASTQVLTHQWLLPQTELQSLIASHQPRLTLDYYMALLKPTRFNLRADGTRAFLPGLGWCGATLDSRNNRIDVDCFSAGPRPALVSAELFDIPASRVDATPPDYAPALAQSISGKRIELSVASPSLLQEPVVTLTAWHDAGTVRASVAREGILGAPLATCPLPAAQPLSSWSDASPHTTSFIAVDDGVQLEVLDWGGEGTPVLLLPGLGATAHSFDVLGPALARHHRVFALTRRGNGGSSRPDTGYDTPTLARDVLRVLDALRLEKAVLIGHSIAGEELSWLGATAPERVAALVYLDAAYDRSATRAEEEPVQDTELPPRPPALPEELRSYASLLPYFERNGADALPEGELMASYNIGNRYLAGATAADMRLMEAIAAAVKPPRYAEIKVPALALYATLTSAEDLMRPWYDREDAALMRKVKARFERMSERQRADIATLRQQMPQAQVIEFPGASHFIFVSREAEVVAAIQEFLP